jgi:hypothetical protein
MINIGDSANNPTLPHLSLAIRELQWLESPKGQQLFNAYHGKMYPSEDPAKTFPAFLELAQTLADDIIPHMYAPFPLPELACRPALSHADFHSSNILVSNDDLTHVTRVVDWECILILPLWSVYKVLPVIEDDGDEYENKLSWRAEKQRSREVFVEAVVQTCPDVACVIDKRNEQSVFGLRMLVGVATDAIALYSSIRECVKRDNEPWIKKLGRLVALFSPTILATKSATTTGEGIEGRLSNSV